MADPLDKATASAPPTLGEGCLSRYDPEALNSEDGTEFPGAAALWQDLLATAAGETPANTSPSTQVEQDVETPAPVSRQRS